MPLDGKLVDWQIETYGEIPDPPIDMSKLKPGNAGLRQIAYLLRHPEIWMDGFEWNFSIILDEYPYSPLGEECGTTGCALGVAALYWGKSVDNVSRKLMGESMRPGWIHTMMDRPNVCMTEELNDIFYYKVNYPMHWDLITPALVAEQIDLYLERHDAP